jgi:hypothetical protein
MLPLGASASGRAGDTAAEFKAFLGRTESGFSVLVGPDASAEAFGLIDEPANSVVLCSAGELIGYGGHTAIRRLAHAFARWAEFGLPGMAAFGLEVFPTAAAPEASQQSWVERRDKTALVWSLPPDATAWRALLDDARSPPSAIAG